MRRLVTFLIAVVTTFVVVGSGTAYARPFGIRSFACESGGLRIICTVETTSGARSPLQIRWVVDGVARPIADDRTMLSICCREGRSTPVQVTIVDADGDSAFASDSVLCRKIHQ